MVKRDVVRVMTPGTLVEDELLPSKANNFLVAICGSATGWGLVAADVSTGECWSAELENDRSWSTLKAQLASLNPSEVLVVGDSSDLMWACFSKEDHVRMETAPAGTKGNAAQAHAALIDFLNRQYPAVVSSLREPKPLPLGSSEVMFLDQTAIRHLELVESSDPERKGPTLLSLLDKTVTPMGSRLLRWWLLHPSCHLPLLKERHDRVGDFLEMTTARAEIRSLFKAIPDMERVQVRVKSGLVAPRELAALRHGLNKFPLIKNCLTETLSVFHKGLDIPSELSTLLATQLSDEPPSKLIDGNVIRDGVNAELDELRGLRRNGKKWIAEMEAAERERTGISSLKVGYNDVFGYFLEVSKSNLSKVPADWMRKQTMTNGERYITPALKEQEEKILGAEEKILALESRLYRELIEKVAGFSAALSRIAETLAHVDVLSALAEAANENNYVRPTITSTNELLIINGRHPVIENQLGHERFIANDVEFNDSRRIVMITGPNMAGKSTYLRQTALLSIMAQMGSFVPAEKMTIGVVDKIFTRIGASDRLAQGQSTFMVEMQEVANLLANATGKSLLVLDEVGRGTSTYDGMSIAWAVIEHLSRSNGSAPRTLFATHYFELTGLADKLPGVVNAHATAREWTNQEGRKQVVFLYQIKPGAADRSYGIHVAEMAGLPETCINRSREILTQLESGDHRVQKNGPKQKNDNQMRLFDEHPVVQEIRGLNLDHLTPMQVFTLLSELKEKC
jgi:DNA mismatch repair protein MutS